VLARFLLDQPALVRGRRVLDLGSGCGAVSLAAGTCGAASIVANDVDPNCAFALRMNAELNGLSLEGVEMEEANLLDLGEASCAKLSTIDVLLIGDMFYDDTVGEQMMDLCRHFKKIKSDNEIYVGDPGRWALHANPRFLDTFLCRANYDLGAACRQENSGFTQGLVWSYA
jgi:predicted nicotinamide N-methyase